MSTETLMPYDEALERFEPVLGLETHVELGTASKMFCGCQAEFGAPPNTHVCPVCLALPGGLPTANVKAIESTIRIGLALNCSIAEWCRFARKNYFYPDMPKNYQISQYDEPLCFDGYLDVEVNGKTVRIEIERVHLEEDTGKSTHVGGATGRIQGADYSIVDYNRAGIPLVEIVTKPIPGTDRLAPEVARAYVTELREVMRTLGVSDVRMEEGSMRCDVNVSLMPRGSSEWGTRTETKNVNSLRSVERAVRSEIERQAAILADGGRIIQETRHFHEDTGHHHLGPVQGGGAGLPLLPRARPGADRARPGVGGRAQGRAARAAAPAAQAAAAGVGRVRPRHGRRCTTPTRSTWSRRRSRPARRPRTPASGGWASWPAAPTRSRYRSGRAADHARTRSPGCARWSPGAR